MGRQAALIALALCGCASAPFGEILVTVDTDVSVPELAGRLRLDLYATDGSWYESREIGTTSASEWPLSFGVYTDDPAGKVARMRLRLFPEGAVRDYRGEQPPGPPQFVAPTIATTLDALCASAPLLPPYTELTQRRGPSLVTQHVPQADCVYMSAAGAVAARIEIGSTDTYRFEVVRAMPDGAHGVVGGDTILFLRRACADAASQLACNDEIDFDRQDYLSRLELALDPGSYYLITGGKPEASPADVTLRWAPASTWATQAPVTPPPPSEAPARLVVDGVDATPDTEPLPARAIDRIVDLQLSYGERSSIGVLLSGECLGTAADLAAGTSCVASAGQRQAFDPATSSVVGETQAGSWAPLHKQACAGTVRAGDPALLDGQVCVPGGVFTVGTDELSGVGALDPSPRQVAVVAPFLIDEHELTVARYRQALAAGYTPPSDADFDQIVNDGPLLRSDPRIGCTWNTGGPAAGIDRERYPLNCISWRNARALCRFLGGDLPTSVEWEYAATASAGRKTRYPWGDEAPDCARTVFDRPTCPGDAPGPEAVDAMPWAEGDRTPLGIAGMGGNVSEWVLDAFRPYRDACWWQHPLRDVGCEEADPPERMLRGGAWDDVAQSMPSSLIIGQAPEFPSAIMGVRCVYRSAP